MYTNVIFVDKEDTHILAIVWNNQKETYFPKVNKIDLEYISFYPVIISPVLNCVDVIGLVDSYGTLEPSSKGDIKLEELPHDGHLMGSTGTPIPGSNGKRQWLCSIRAAAVLSSGDGTKTYCNIDYNPLKALKKALLAATGHTEESLPPPTKARLITAAPVPLVEVSIQHILDAEPPKGNEIIRYLCEATIVDLLKHETWFCNSCPNCPHHIQIQDTKFYCGRCLVHVDTYTQRYRVNVVVQDSSGKTTFTLFNKEVERLIRVPIMKIIAEIGQLDNEIPPVLRNMVGRKCLFEVKANAYNQPGRDGFTVARLSEDPQGTPAATSGTADDAGPSKKQRTV
ncbi:hypothetical protein POM88_023080 [Heracleum sosnowskyi]|uniref:Replication factor A C-terminal domain-containing protein n=1 Tax=Heracleum sosnowskyi TaxID=360622 RepID=A0AAD8IK01_9APIA|nr:hypothetical protein POM88_023080 [Heracleum sosnowskyi]